MNMKLEEKNENYQKIKLKEWKRQNKLQIYIHRSFIENLSNEL